MLGSVTTISVEEARALAEAAERNLERIREERDSSRAQLRAAFWIAFPLALAMMLWEMHQGGANPLLPVVFAGMLAVLMPIAWCGMALWALLLMAADYLGWLLFDD